jgi:multiple sugar transport system ATP-binding protein
MGDRIAVMKDGVLQQVGTPQELYDNPLNVFVAGFIGSPAMNFATVKTTEGEDLMLGGSKLVLSGKAAKAAAGQPKGADLLIGFRPEHLDVADGRGDVVKIPARVDVVEYLGNEELIHAQAEGTEIVALIPSERKVKPGEQVELGVPLDKLHVFDPKTEQSLIEGGQT